MQEITSVSNEMIKEAAKLQQKKFRNQTGRFLLEGYKPIYEAFCENIEIEKVYVNQKHLERFSFLQNKITLVSDSVMEKISTTETAPEAVAVAKQKNYTLENIKNHSRIALLQNIKDAGNLGTIIRSAAAFGIESIILCGETIDLYNPKVVRSSVGGLFKVPVVNSEIHCVRKQFKNSKFIATVVNHTDIVNPNSIDYNKHFVIMLGSEADGLTDEAIEMSDIKTTIPISNNTESLNLSVAASILFYITAC